MKYKKTCRHSPTLSAPSSSFALFLKVFQLTNIGCRFYGFILYQGYISMKRIAFIDSWLGTALREFVFSFVFFKFTSVLLLLLLLWYLRLYDDVFVVILLKRCYHHHHVCTCGCLLRSELHKKFFIGRIHSFEWMKLHLN